MFQLYAYFFIFILSLIQRQRRLYDDMIFYSKDIQKNYQISFTQLCTLVVNFFKAYYFAQTYKWWWCGDSIVIK